MGSVKRLAEKENNKGYVKNAISGEHFRFVSMGTTHTSYITAAVVMLVFVSMPRDLSDPLVIG